jgi:hypothetical protein
MKHYNCTIPVQKVAPFFLYHTAVLPVDTRIVDLAILSFYQHGDGFLQN